MPVMAKIVNSCCRLPVRYVTPPPLNEVVSRFSTQKSEWAWSPLLTPLSRRGGAAGNEHGDPLAASK
jgi:hypothetical protein